MNWFHLAMVLAFYVPLLVLLAQMPDFMRRYAHLKDPKKERFRELCQRRLEVDETWNRYILTRHNFPRRWW